LKLRFSFISGGPKGINRLSLVKISKKWRWWFKPRLSIL